MRISRDTINSTFRALANEKEEKYLARYPRPVPPTDKEIADAIRAGAFKVSTKCGCTIRDTPYRGYVERFPLSEILKVTIIETYKRKAAAHRKRVDELKAKVETRRKEDFTYCMYGPGQTEKGAFYAKVEAFKRWNP